MAGDIKSLDVSSLLGQVFKPDIANLLKERLSGEAKTTAIFDKVNPGDLITASLINDILKRLRDLEAAINKLPSADQVEITSLYPSGPVHIGDKLTILGRNFGQPASNSVTINEAIITKFDDSSDDKHLMFTIPVVQAATEQGALVTLTLSNPQGFDSTPLTLLKAVQPLGVTLYPSPHLSPDVEELEAGKSYRFTFTVSGITTQDETYTLTASVTDASVTDDQQKPLAWNTATFDEDGNPASEIKIPKGDTTRDVGVELTIPLGTADGSLARLRLTVASRQKPEFKFTSGSFPIEVGEAPPPTYKIPISVSRIFPPGRDTGDALVVPSVDPLTHNKVGPIPIKLKAQINKTGKYTITGPSVENLDQRWKTTLISSATLPVERTGPLTISTEIQALDAEATTTNLLLEIKKDDEPDFFGKFSYPISTP